MFNRHFLVATALGLACAAYAGAQVPPSPAFPVSDPPTLGPAPLDQVATAVDTNGSVALAAWADNRSGVAQAYAARIDLDGMVLDPLGIRLGDGTPRAVIWAEDEFIVLIETGDSYALLTVDEGGTVGDRITLDISEPFVAASDGESIRLLFLERVVFRDGARFVGQLVDPTSSQITTRPLSFSPPPSGYDDVGFVAGTNGSDILVLRVIAHPSQPRRVLADRVSPTGDITSVDSNLPDAALDERDALAGNDTGYILVQTTTDEQADLRSYQLDTSGVFTGRTGSLDPPAGPLFNQMDLVRDGDRYLLVFAPRGFRNRAITFVAPVEADASFGAARTAADWEGFHTGTAIAAAGPHRIVLHGVHESIGSSASDVFSTILDSSLEPEEPQLVSRSATLQSGVVVAASQSGYIAGWGENGPDRFARVFVRRFSPHGQPIDAAPREIFAIQQDASALLIPEVRVASTPTAYVVAWLDGGTLFARRMGAAAPEWTDAAALVIATGVRDFDVSTNGSDALLAWTAPCGAAARCLFSRRLVMTASPSLTEPAVLSSRGWAYEPTIGSKGDDFLVGWSEGSRECQITCGLELSSIEVARVGANGNPIDQQPIIVENRRTYAQKPAIVFDGDDYVVLWAAWSNGWTVRAARVTPQGSVTDTDGPETGTVVDGAAGPSAVQPVAAASQGRVVVFHRSSAGNGVQWNMFEFDADTPLREVASRPRQLWLQHRTARFGSLDAAIAPNRTLYLGFDTEGVSGVSRAFVAAPFGTPAPPRRRAAGR